MEGEFHDPNDTLYNYTDDDDDDPMSVGFDPKVDVLPIVLALLIIIANGIVLRLFANNFRLRTITNTFLVSLAISDLTLGTLGIPFYLVCSCTHYLLCDTTYIILRFISTSTVLHLLLVTIDRYAAIVHAIRYHTLVTRTRAYVAIASVWSLATTVSLIQLSWPSVDEAEQQGMSDQEINKIATIAGVYQAVTLAAFFIIPLLFMLFSYMRIFLIVRYHEKQIKRQNLPSNATTKKQKEIPAQWKSAIVFMVMTAVFVVCWFPYFFYEPLQELLTNLSPWVQYAFFYYPRFATSLTNPIVYIVGKNDFKKVLWKKKSREECTTQMTSLITRGPRLSNNE